LGEQLRRQEWLGAAMILAGVLMITYYSDRVMILVFLMALGNTFLHASGAVIAKRAVGDVTPLTLTLVRAGGSSILILIAALLSGRWQWPSTNALILTALGALGGPFISHILYYRALALIDVSKVSLINATRPLFVLLYSLLLFGNLPLLHQTAGGLLSIIGVVTLLSARRPAPAYQPNRVTERQKQ
jgi:drug/metabolite transporter (DMT)-like permease